MKYNNITRGRFISRPNRFIAIVEVDGEEQTVHVKNTGRCKELLVKGCTVFLEKSKNLGRKTAYDLVAVIKEDGKGATYINMDSQAPNTMAAEWLPQSGLFPQGTVFKREVRYKSSRFDFCAEHGEGRTYIEVKGVTLEREGMAYFPDAPTERGVKHLKELAECVKEGYGAMVLFVVQMQGVAAVRPNTATHPQFATALKAAKAAGVKVLAVDCLVGEGRAEIASVLKVETEF